MEKVIKYRSGYKYQLAQDYLIFVNIFPERDIMAGYIRLSRKGLLIIRRGYAWDGPSGPTIDTHTFMRGSLVHDVLYQLIRQGFLKPEDRLLADLELKKICEEDGMAKFRIWWVYKALRKFANFAALPESRKKIKSAPKEIKC